MDVSKELSRFKEGSEERIFLENVFEKLSPNFVPKLVENKRREVKNKLDTAMQNYFETHIFSSALIKAVEQIETQRNSAVSLNSVHPIYLNLVKKYLPPESSEEPKLFGITKENVLKYLESKNLQSERQALKEQMEENIDDFCRKLIEYTGGIVSSDKDWDSAFDSVIKDIQYKTTLLSEDTKERSNKKIREVVNRYYEELTNCITLLLKLLSLHEEKFEFGSNLTNCYLQKCRATSLKIRVFEKKVLEMTYNEETIPVLEKIRDQLDQNERKLTEEQNEKAVALDQYLKLGEEFDALTDEYSRLTKSIQQQQWSLDELKTSCAHSGDTSCE